MKPRKKAKVSTDQLTVTRRVTRSMSLANGSGDSLPIPIELIIMIFSRLPLKSVAICRCVSKLWASILRRSDFTELYLSRSCSRGPQLLFAHQKSGELYLFSSPQPQNLIENSYPVVWNYQMKFSYDGYFQNNDLVHGLMFFNDKRFVKGKVEILQKICNPSTRQILILPNVNSKQEIRWSLFGYDPIGKQFKILSMEERLGVGCENYHVMTLGTQKLSWRMVECGLPRHFSFQKICINGVLYYPSVDWETKSCIIACFDVRFEKFSSIKLMGTMNEAIFNKEVRFDDTFTLINYNGKLGLIQCRKIVKCALFIGRSVSFKLWVLEDVEKQEWSEHTFEFSAMPENVLGDSRHMLEFVGVTQKREIVLSSFSPSVPFYLFFLNLEKMSIVRVRTQGTDDACHNGLKYICLGHVENVKLF